MGFRDDGVRDVGDVGIDMLRVLHDGPAVRLMLVSGCGVYSDTATNGRTRFVDRRVSAESYFLHLQMFGRLLNGVC